MSRFVSGGLLVLALAAAPLLGSAVGKAPPVAMPEAPPELPAGAVDLSPPRDASHDHAGHMHDHAGHTHGAPADRRPSLVPAPWSPTPVEPPHAAGPHGGALVPLEPEPLQWVYDEANHALTIYLPQSMRTPVEARSPHAGHGHASPVEPYYEDHACPLGHGGRSFARSDCMHESYRHGAEAYECEYQRRHRSAAHHYPHVHAAPHAAWDY